MKGKLIYSIQEIDLTNDRLILLITMTNTAMIEDMQAIAIRRVIEGGDMIVTHTRIVVVDIVIINLRLYVEMFVKNKKQKKLF